jgi:hypothetical protein
VSAILIISVFLVFVATIAILRTKRSQSKEEAQYLPPFPRPPRLFDESAYGSLGEGLKEESERRASEEFEKELHLRAARGDLEVLKDAHASGEELYRRVLDRLVERRGESADELRALADFVTQNGELRASTALAERLIEDWQRNPSRASVTRLLRVAALSDDAATFERALSSVLRARNDGRLTGISAEVLRTLFEGEYWLLSSEAKRSGAGFLLKQRLAHVRRELSAEARRESTTPTGDDSDEVSAQRERQ